MIARFPNFSKLDISHKADVEKIVAGFKPYSDFNFISLFSWNTDGSTEISRLNDNLVIKLPHYTRGTPIYSLLGKDSIDESLKKVLASVDKLHLVPESVVKKIKKTEDFIVQEDPDNHDYVYLVEDHAHLHGKKFSGKRKKAARFSERHRAKFEVEEVSISNKLVAKKVLKIFDSWASDNNKSGSEVNQERQALNRLLKHAPNFDTIGLVISVDEQPAGFSIHELVGKDYAICHFHKTVRNYGNIDIYLTSEAAKDLNKRGRNYVNWEQDLGLDGLRQSKLSYHPVRMLKKYTVSLAG